MKLNKVHNNYQYEKICKIYKIFYSNRFLWVLIDDSKLYNHKNTQKLGNGQNYLENSHEQKGHKLYKDKMNFAIFLFLNCNRTNMNVNDIGMIFLV